MDAAPRAARENPAIKTTPPSAVQENVLEPAKAQDEKLFSEEKVNALSAPQMEDTAEWRKADAIVAYNNHARAMEGQSWFRAPLILRNNTAEYLDEWRLKSAPKVSAGKNFTRNLTAPKGIFSDKEERVLTSALKDMDEALAKMLGHYASLEKYAKDDSVIDDGRQGREIGARMNAEYGRFMRARHTWREIVRQRAAEAEEVLLRAHPLRRQILAAGSIFSAISEVSDMLGTGSPDKKILGDIASNLENQIQTGQKPPFPSSPDLERLYRAFLHEAQAYEETLRRAVLEGMGNLQQRELLVQAAKCATSYNEFARACSSRL